MFPVTRDRDLLRVIEFDCVPAYRRGRKRERDRPRVTIVIPTHDRPRLLERAVASALAQTVQDMQVVVVDDGSAEPVRFEQPDPRLVVLRNPRALGARPPATPAFATSWPLGHLGTDDDDELLPDMVRVSPGGRAVDAPEAGRILSGSTWSTPRSVAEIWMPVTVARRAPLPAGPRRGVRPGRQQPLRPRRGAALDRRVGRDHQGLEMDDLLIRLVQVCSIQGAPGSLPPLPPRRAAQVRWGRAGPRRRPAGAAQAPQVLPGAPAAPTAGSWPSSAPATSATGAGGRPCRR